MPIAASFSRRLRERDLEPGQAREARQRQRHPARLRLLRVAVDALARRRAPPPSRASIAAARRLACGMPFGVDAALEAVRRLASAGPAAWRCGARCADRRSPPRAAPRSSSPRPRCRRRPSRRPARPRRASSAITTSLSCSGRSTPSSVVMRSPRFARRTWMPPAQLVEVERVQRVAGLQHHVVGDVDQVRDRAHAAGRQPHAHRAAGSARRVRPVMMRAM